MRTAGQNIDIGTLKLCMLPETEREPKKRKIGKNAMLSDLLPTTVIQIINKMHGGIIQQENFLTLMAQLTRKIIPLLRFVLNNNWNFFGLLLP